LGISHPSGESPGLKFRCHPERDVKRIQGESIREDNIIILPAGSNFHLHVLRAMLMSTNPFCNDIIVLETMYFRSHTLSETKSLCGRQIIRQNK